jgi:hypothetical protein
MILPHSLNISPKVFGTQILNKRWVLILAWLSKPYALDSNNSIINTFNINNGSFCFFCLTFSKY